MRVFLSLTHTSDSQLLADWFGRQQGMTEDALLRVFRTYYGYTEPFRKETESHEK